MKRFSVLKFFVILLAVIFVGHQVISAIYNPVKTENAVYYTAVDAVNITGVIMRNETLVRYDNAGVMHFVVPDGGRVAKNGVIANVYDSEEASITVSQIEDIKKKISDIQSILSYNDIEASNIDLINSKVDENLNRFVLASANGNFSQMSDCADELLSAINRKQAALGDTTNFSSQLESLNANLSSLSAALPTAKGQVSAEQSGYFVSKTDGYETVFTCADLTAVTPEFLSGATAQKTEKSVIGKIVSDYEWYIAGEVSINDSLEFKEGDEIKITTSVKTSPELSAKVAKINISENSGKAVVLFACNEMNRELAAMRSGPMTVIKAEYSGLKVPREALRVIDSKKGVYVLNGMQIDFVPVEIIYSNESYIICKKQTENDQILKLYDRVVVKGKNLYDGKIVS